MSPEGNAGWRLVRDPGGSSLEQALQEVSGPDEIYVYPAELWMVG